VIRIRLIRLRTHIAVVRQSLADVRCAPESSQIADVSIGPSRAERRGSALQQNVVLFDHLVGAGQHGAGNGEAEGLSSLEIDEKLEMSGHLERQISRSSTA